MIIVPTECNISCNASQCMGYMSCDKKNSWAVQGQGESASAYANCIVYVYRIDII